MLWTTAPISPLSLTCVSISSLLISMRISPFKKVGRARWGQASDLAQARKPACVRASSGTMISRSSSIAHRKAIASLQKDSMSIYDGAATFAWSVVSTAFRTAVACRHQPADLLQSLGHLGWQDLFFLVWLRGGDSGGESIIPHQVRDRDLGQDN